MLQFLQFVRSIHVTCQLLKKDTGVRVSFDLCYHTNLSVVVRVVKLSVVGCGKNLSVVASNLSVVDLVWYHTHTQTTLGSH